MLQNDLLLANFRFDTAKNELSKVDAFGDFCELVKKVIANVGIVAINLPAEKRSSGGRWGSDRVGSIHVGA